MEAVCGVTNHSDPRRCCLWRLRLFIWSGFCRDVPRGDSVPVTIGWDRLSAIGDAGETVAAVWRFLHQISLAHVSILREEFATPSTAPSANGIGEVVWGV